MKSLFNRTLPALGLMGLTLASCQPDLEKDIEINKGTADFSNYVALGNSLTAGYQSGGLFNRGQQDSYPNILAQQFAKVGGGAFTQPLFEDNQKDGSGYLNFQGFTTSGSPILLSPGQAGNTRVYQLAYTGQQLPSGQNQLAPSKFAGNGQPNNLGIPGISVLSSVSALTGGLAPYGLLNPFLNRLLTPAEQPSVDYLTYVSRATPTFFTNWLGNNDVLTYATNGAVADPFNPFSNLTDTTRFGIGYRAIMQTITKNGTVKGVVATIPNVTNIPYFSAVTIPALVKAFQAVNPAVTSVYIQTGAGDVRAAAAGDLLTLTASAAAGTGLGISPANPLPSKYVLDKDEIPAIQTRTTQLNNIIAKTARQYKVPVADMNAFFSGIASSGVAINATANSASFLQGNLFSLDGVHPTSRGYALIANEFIRVINTTYGASVPTVDPNNYDAVRFP